MATSWLLSLHNSYTSSFQHSVQSVVMQVFFSICIPNLYISYRIAVGQKFLITYSSGKSKSCSFSKYSLTTSTLLANVLHLPIWYCVSFYI
nr:MAG TPA: hypothetical protein [Caudoviricetes sp.]